MCRSLVTIAVNEIKSCSIEPRVVGAAEERAMPHRVSKELSVATLKVRAGQVAPAFRSRI